MSDYVIELSDGRVLPIEADDDAQAICRAIRAYTTRVTRIYVGHPYLPSLRVVWRQEEVPDDPIEFERGRECGRLSGFHSYQVLNIDSWESLYWATELSRLSSRSFGLGYVYEVRRIWREFHGMDTES